MTGRPPSPRQRQSFEAFARQGDMTRAASELGISLSRLKKNLAEYYRRVGAVNGVQAAYLTWAPRE